MRTSYVVVVLLLGGLCLGSEPTSKPAVSQLSEVAALRLRLSEAQREISRLRLENARLKAELAKMKTAPAAAVASRPAPPSARGRTFKLNDPAPATQQEAQARIGCRAYGQIVLRNISPPADGVGMYTVQVSLGSDGQPHVVPMAGRRHGESMEVWCVVKATEGTALRLRLWDEMNVAGDVESVEFTRPAGGRSGKVVYHLRNVDMR